MSEPPIPAGSLRRHPWPRFLVRARRAWFGVTETVSFFAAAAAAVGRFLFGRWPEPPGRDYLAPRGRERREDGEQFLGARLTSHKAPRRRREQSIEIQSQ